MSLLGRVSHPMLAAVFVTSGVETLLDPGPQTQRARDAGLDDLPVGNAATLTRASAAIQVGAGALLATNRAPRLAALALAATLVPTTYAGHPFWGETDKQTRGQQRTHFVKNLGLLGGLLLTVGEPRKSRRHRRRHKARAAH